MTVDRNRITAITAITDRITKLSLQGGATMPFTGLLGKLSLRSHRGKGRHNRQTSKRKVFGRLSALEELEPRRLLVSRVFLDFGDGFNNTPAAPYDNASTISVSPSLLNSALVGGNGGNEIKDELGLFVASPPSTSVGTLRIVSYNIDDFDRGSDANITGQPASGPAYDPGIPTVLNAIGLHHIGSNAQAIDVLGLEDIIPGVSDVAIANALNAIYGDPTKFDYVAAPPISDSIGFVYNQVTVNLVTEEAVPLTSALRGNVASGVIPHVPMRYQFHPAGFDSTQDVYMYVDWANETDTNARYKEAQQIRDDAETLPVSTHIMYTGDWELANGSSENAYKCLTGQTTTGDGINWAQTLPNQVGRDPTSSDTTITSWNSNEEGSNYLYSADTSTLGTRLDLQLVNLPMLKNDGVQLAPDTSDPFTGNFPSSHYKRAYIVFGNNGTTAVGDPTNLPTNTSLNDLPDPPGATEVLKDLMEFDDNGNFIGSDHLPVVGDYSIVVGADIQYTLVPFADLINDFTPTPVPADARTLEIAITEQIQRALEPFDIQVVSSAEPNAFGLPPFVQKDVGEASAHLALNNLASDNGSPKVGTAAVPQYGSDDIYILICGVYRTLNNQAIPQLIPISAEFSESVIPSDGAVPNRSDSGAVIDANYWIHRVLDPDGSLLGSPGTGGSLNVAIGNAIMYSIGWDYGLSEVENGVGGPFTNYFDPNTAKVNQSNAMVEAGYSENLTINNSVSRPISDQNSAYFSRIPMMQDGVDLNQLLQPGILGHPPLGVDPLFPLPPPGYPFFILDPNDPLPPAYSQLSFQDAFTLFVETINEDPTQTVNSYNQLANDPDIGPNPDVAYVSGTGAFDQITISKLNAKQAHVTVNAFDKTYTDPSRVLIDSFSYNINLTKLVIPGRKDDGQPFRIVVDGATNDDEIFLDPTLGVNVEVHGGPSVKVVQLTGNSAYNVQYIPAAPPAANDTTVEISSLIAEGLIPGAGGTMKITGSTSTTVGKKITTTPFTTTITFDHFNPANNSKIRLDTFNKLTYMSPGFLSNEFTVTAPDAGVWNIAGQVDSPFFAPAFTGNLQLTNVKQLDINTTLGASNDTITFATGGQLPTGLQGVSVETGTGIDALNIDDSSGLTPMNYSIGPTLLQYIPVVGPLFQGFTGISYTGTESVTVTGAPGDNTYVVSPSLTTAFNINDDSSSDDDTLAVRLNGTTGATPAAPGSGTITFGSDATHPLHQPINYSNIENFQPPPDAATPNNAILAVGAGAGGVSKPLIKVYNATTHDLEYQFYAYQLGFKGGVQVTTADMNGDGTQDIIVAPNAGRAGEVEVFDGATLFALGNPTPLVPLSNAVAITARIADFFPDTAGAGFKNGLNIAVGDLDNDGNVDIITSRARGVPLVRTWLNTGAGTSYLLGLSFNPYTTKNGGGAVVAAGDIDGDGRADIITAPGAGQIVTVKIFDPQTQVLLNQFNGFENTFKGGVSLAAGDIDADGKAEIVLGAGTGGKSRVRVFNADQGILLKEFQAYTTGTINAPVHVAVHDSVYGDEPDTGIHAESIYTGQGVASVTHDVRIFEPLSGAQVDHFLEAAIDMKGGVELG